MSSTARALRAARAAVDGGDLATALDRLLEAWAETPAPAIADAIELVGRHAQAGRDAPSGRTAKARAAAWFALAKEHENDNVMRGLLVEQLGETVADTLERVELLARGPKDPRFSSRLGDLVERPRYNASLPRTTAFWRRIFVLLAEVGDPRLLVRARGFPATWAASNDLTQAEKDVLPKRFARDALPGLEAAYEERPLLEDTTACDAIIAAMRALDDDARAALDVARDARLEGRVTAARRLVARASEQDLLDAIYAAPDDDDARRDYAEWLVQRGDVRGEFITLQLEGSSSARAEALLAEHKTRWLGPLAKMVKVASATFARGFLDSCSLKGTWVQRLDDDPAWATVRSIGLGNAGMIQLAAITRPLSLVSIDWEVGSAQGREYGSDAAIAAFQRLRLPTLRRLRVWGDLFRFRPSTDWVREAPCVQALEALAIDT